MGFFCLLNRGVVAQPDRFAIPRQGRAGWDAATLFLASDFSLNKGGTDSRPGRQTKAADAGEKGVARPPGGPASFS